MDADLCVDFRTGCDYSCYELGGFCRMTGIDWTARRWGILALSSIPKACSTNKGILLQFSIYCLWLLENAHIHVLHY